MVIPTKKLQNGFEMPVFGLGTWQMGGRHEHDLNNNDDADIAAVRQALDAGITHIDTAESYAQGYAEVLVGKAIKPYDRSKIFLASKAHQENLSYERIIHSAKESLKRLQTDYLDLYYAHRFNPDIPLKETMRGMDSLVEEGLIRHIAVSNFTVEQCKEAQSYTKHKIVANQLHLNLQYREAERKGLVEYCQQNDIFFVAWRPLQKGMLLEEKSGVLFEMMQKYKKTAAQIAINWLISQKNMVTLSKMGSKEHLKENLGALGWEMEKEDIARLDKEFPNQQDISDAVPLI
ncbi:MAG TPA: aldo/keto reductase [Patescibacteria group bacterium]|nr:aldo/keto reductase [Patescibacteria group bacterium]